MSEVLVFDVKGDWAHFRKIEGNVVKRSYKTPPKTTTAGMLSAICGFDRDSYYEYFNSNNCKYAVTTNSEIRSVNIPISNLKFDSDTSTKLNSRGKPTLIIPDSRKPRQRNTYEFLADPDYRIFMKLEDEDLMEEIKDRLKEKNYVYSPCLGISENLCDIEYVGCFDEKDEDSDKVDSTVPIEDIDIIPESDVTYSTEKQPSEMKKTGFGNRKTTEFEKIAFGEGDKVKVSDPERVRNICDENIIMY